MAGPFSAADKQTEPNAGVADGKPLHVLEIAEAETFGRGEESARALAKAVIAAGGRATLAGAGLAANRLAVTGAELLRFGAETRRRARREAAAALANALNGAGVDVVHAHDAAAAETGAVVASALGARFVTSLHQPAPTGLFARSGVRPLLEGERIVADSAAIADSAAKGLHGRTERLIAIPPGVDMDVFAEEVVPPTRTIRTAEVWGLAEDTRPLILAPEPVGPGSGAEILVEAAARLAQLGAPEALCILVTDDPAPALEQAIMARGLAGHAKLAPPALDLPAALKLSAVVVSAATEPPATGAYLVEAQAMGRPVIAPNHGAAAEVVEHGGTGWLTPPGDAAALAQALAEALSLDESQLAHMGLAGRARVRSRFTLGGSLGAVLAVYEELTGRPVAPPQ